MSRVNLLIGKAICSSFRAQVLQYLSLGPCRFIVYKLPRIDGLSSGPWLRKSGFAYLYMDGSTAGQWRRSEMSIDDQRQSLGFTLAQYYATRSNTSVFRLLYNDEVPQGNVSFTKGHTKGTSHSKPRSLSGCRSSDFVFFRCFSLRFDIRILVDP